MNDVLDLLVETLKPFEGCRLKAYKDWVGVWTIGWGETLGVKEGMMWTQVQADARLRTRAAQFMVAAYKACPQLLVETPTRQVACVSLEYNIGIGAFSASSVCRKTKRKEYPGAADSFLLWNKAGGKVDRVLVLRRAKERALYLV
jgi:lysozyme